MWDVVNGICDVWVFILCDFWIWSKFWCMEFVDLFEEVLYMN